MKSISVLLLLLSVLYLPEQATASSFLVGKKNVFTEDNPSFFRRAYTDKEGVVRQSRMTVHRKKGRSTKSQGVVITFDDFTDHLALDKARIAQVVDIENVTLTMDVKGFDTLAQTWTMPNFNNYSFEEVAIEHVTLESSGFQDSFPNLTHAFYAPTLNQYEFYELNQDELFLYGLGKFDENDQPFAEDYYLTQSFLPLEEGWEFEGTVTFIYEGDPELDSLQLIQSYYSIGQGTLNTYDEGPVDAVKLYFVEEFLEFKDGEEISYDYYDEMVWYSKQGHYIRAGFSEGAPIEGVTSFDYMVYQKIGSTLPVSWESFHAKLNKEQAVELHWRTVSEENNSHFLVQRSTDGKTFTTIGKVKAGDRPLSVQEYSFVDEEAKAGTNYYRIQQVDVDGTRDNSEIVNVLVSGAAKDDSVILLYPNPGKDQVWFSQPADYELFDTSGRLLISGRAEGAVDVSGLPKGTYLVRINGGTMHSWLKQ